MLHAYHNEPRFAQFRLQMAKVAGEIEDWDPIAEVTLKHGVEIVLEERAFMTV